MVKRILHPGAPLGLGVPLKLNDDLIEKLHDLVMTGITTRGICGSLRISPPTFYSWIKTGEADILANKVDTLHARFVIQFNTSNAELEKVMLEGALSDGAIGKRWYLGRRFKEYQEKQEVEVSISEPEGTVTSWLDRLAHKVP